MPEVGCCRTRQLGALPHWGWARGGSTLQSGLVVGEGEVGFSGIGSVEAKKSGADDYRVQDEVHDPEESDNMLGRLEVLHTAWPRREVN